MEPSPTILRVKRKRGTDPADALLLACKRIRPEPTVGLQPAGDPVPEPGEGEIENSVFKLVATVASQDAPVQAHVREALARPRVAHALRPSSGSTQRIVGDLRSAKWATRREERYRVLSTHRAGLPGDRVPPVGREMGDGAEEPTDRRRDTAAHWSRCDVQVFDIVQEEEEKAPTQLVTSDPETILCNSVKMIRERLSVSGDGVGSEHREKEEDYVYDLYYQETLTPGWIQDILSVRPYLQENELVPEEDPGQVEIYEDEDDENEEGNWRNDYPDEESSEGGSDFEERCTGFGEAEAGAGRTWERYQREALREYGYENEDEDEDSGGSDLD
ncbi:probable RNA polymerase II nuclear localization protein SLC7A6OS isoform X2 [Conger conger]|uniref:probable RNA polymerase II nuclear localization protein SLC7A6OS isoform X2 n=1 Tax=Conger conger TaxID=82655 RepID=UPI002A5A43ED|nr:probable RNA polymerase II nuclear localization protein SLC7A6OS isoform X2 [Conger conger]